MRKYFMEDEIEGQRIRRKTDREVTELHLDTAGLETTMSVVDIGCASGEVTRHIASRVAPIPVIGYDLSFSRVAEARKIDTDKSVKNIRYVVGDVYDIGIRSDTFDFVWCRFLFEYLKEPIRALKELKRITRPGGKVVVVDIDGNMVNHYPIPHELQEDMTAILQILRQRTGFDPFVGRKLYNYFVRVGLKDISVSILPYHQVFGTPSDLEIELWRTKLEIAAKNFQKIAPEAYSEKKKAFSDLLELIERPDTLTYSTVFIVRGCK